MKKLLLIVTNLIVVLSIVKSQDVVLTPKWIESRTVGAYTPVGTESRCVAYYNDTLYFSDRAVNVPKMRLYSAQTGNFGRAFILDEMSSDNLPSNCIRADAVGNIIVSNLAVDVKSGAPLRVYKMTNDTPTLILEYTDPTAPKAVRIDFISIYGNVNGEGYIMGAITGTGTQDQDKTVLKWNISGGVVSSTPEKIILSEHYPTSTTSNGMIPQIFPVDDTSFYFDGAASYPALYGTNGSLLDGFMNAGSVIKPSEATNGVATVKLGNKHFMVCGANSVTNSFYLYEMGEGGAFSGMKLISEFPEDGLGTATNDRNVVLPIIEKVSETLANIYIYAFNNGYAKYELELNPASATFDILEENTYILNKNGTIYFKDRSNVEIYNISGHRVTFSQGVTSIDAPKNTGFYTVRAVNQTGLIVTKKIIIN